MTAPVAFRIALHLVTRRNGGSSWRLTAVAVAAFYAMLLALGALSVFLLLEREHARVESRMPLVAGPEDSPRTLLIERDDSWDGNQFPVFWIEPVAAVQPALPPGLSRMLEPGESAVSPRLDDLARKHPELDARYPRRIVLDNVGLQNPRELIAYYRSERPLGDSPMILRVAAFGIGPAELRGPVGQADAPHGAPVVSALLALVVVPGLVVVACGLGAQSSAREYRFQVLQWIGAPVSMLSSISAMEVAFVAVPLAVILGFGWYGLSGSLDAIPILNRPVIRGDLQPPLWACFAAAGGIALVAAILSAAAAAFPARGGSARSRPGLRPGVISPVRLVVLVSVWILLAAGTQVLDGGRKETIVVLAGLAVIPLAAVAAAPHGVRACGAFLRRTAVPELLLAGRRMEWDPRGSGRPFLAVTALVALAVGTVGYTHARMSNPDEATGTPGAPQAEMTVNAASAALVSWGNPAPGDLDLLKAALGADTVVLGLRKSPDGGVTISGTCPDLAQLIPLLPCNPADPYDLLPEARAKLPPVVPPAVPVRLSGEHAVGHSGALVISAEPQASLHQRCLTAAMSIFPAPTVQSPPSHTTLKHGAFVVWLILEMGIGASALLLGAVLSSVNGVKEWRQNFRPFVMMGIGREQMRRLQMTVFLMPFAMHVGLGIANGLAACWLIVNNFDAMMPWDRIWFLTAITVVFGLAGSVLAYAFAPAIQQLGRGD